MARHRYKVQFTVSQEYVDLLERAQDLVSHAVPNRLLEAVHLRALRLLVDQLEKRKYGAHRSARPAEHPTSESSATAARSKRESIAQAVRAAEHPTGECVPKVRGPSRHRSGRSKARSVHVLRASASLRTCDARCEIETECSARLSTSWGTVAAKRGSSSYTTNSPTRGVVAKLREITIYCRAHNELAADQDFGREFMRGRRSRPP